MNKVPVEYGFGDSVIVVLRTTVQQVVEWDNNVEVITDHGTYASGDDNLIAIWPDPEDS